MIRSSTDTLDPRIAVLTLDRAEKRNAMTPDMLDALASGATAAHRVGARVIVLAGAGPVFSSGFDLALCRDTPGATAELLTTLSHAMRTLRALPIPIVGAPHGGAIAGACALLTACDFILADSRATFGYPVVRLGISPAVSAPTLALLVPGGHLRELLLNPQLVGAPEALRLGILHSITDTPEQVLPAALALARTLAAKPPHSLAITKSWLNELDASADPARLDRALGASLALAGADEERARLAQLSL